MKLAKNPLKSNDFKRLQAFLAYCRDIKRREITFHERIKRKRGITVLSRPFLSFYDKIPR